jgi:ribonuclease HI
MYIIFVDGAVSGNPGGPGGCGVVMRTPKGRVYEFGCFEDNTTNQRTELLAAILALEELEEGEAALVVSDSQYVVKGITDWIHNWIPRGWRNANGKDVANRDLWERLHALNMRRSIEWQHVRGHRGIPGNERADKIAVAFKTHEEIDLYEGSYEDYDIELEKP